MIEIEMLKEENKKLRVEKAYLLADKISNEIMRKEFDTLREEVVKLRKENADLNQKMKKKEKKKIDG